MSDDQRQAAVQKLRQAVEEFVRVGIDQGGKQNAQVAEEMKRKIDDGEMGIQVLIDWPDFSATAFPAGGTDYLFHASIEDAGPVH